MDYNKTPQEIAADIRYEQTKGDDPAKIHKVSLDGVKLIEDEYFVDGPFADFVPAQRELDQLKREMFKKELAKLIELKRMDK